MGITALFLLSVLGFAITAEAQSCSKPVGEANMSLKDDFINQDTFVNGAVVSFACNPGYTSAGGSSKITCSAGVWSPVQLRCESEYYCLITPCNSTACSIPIILLTILS
ncbi:hypothetical protein CHARACLAT_031584 [Characodon lateralis]|uniref:Sushi domain-containing protein n=1 Tax=Characodon lateralis TaxID=208331 RepID=A0ABU7EEI1_9TELE|nr:hypothetical protein [Characodon lateralis]